MPRSLIRNKMDKRIFVIITLVSIAILLISVPTLLSPYKETNRYLMEQQAQQTSTYKAELVKYELRKKTFAAEEKMLKNPTLAKKMFTFEAVDAWPIASGADLEGSKVDIKICNKSNFLTGTPSGNLIAISDTFKDLAWWVPPVEFNEPINTKSLQPGECQTQEMSLKKVSEWRSTLNELEVAFGGEKPSISRSGSFMKNPIGTLFDGIQVASNTLNAPYPEVSKSAISFTNMKLTGMSFVGSSFAPKLPLNPKTKSPYATLGHYIIDINGFRKHYPQQADWVLPLKIAIYLSFFSALVFSALMSLETPKAIPLTGEIDPDYEDITDAVDKEAKGDPTKFDTNISGKVTIVHLKIDSPTLPETRIIPLSHHHLEARKGGLVMGRDKNVCDLRIGGSQISKRHIRISISPAGFSLQCLSSISGTFLNGEKLSPYKLAVLNYGDKITIGKTNMKLEARDA